mgnify:CR=1 FL=1
MLYYKHEDILTSKGDEVIIYYIGIAMMVASIILSGILGEYTDMFESYEPSDTIDDFFA